MMDGRGSMYTVRQGAMHEWVRGSMLNKNILSCGLGSLICQPALGQECRAQKKVSNISLQNHIVLKPFRQYAHFIVTIIGVIISSSTIAEPFLVWAVAPDTTWDQW